MTDSTQDLYIMADMTDIEPAAALDVPRWMAHLKRLGRFENLDRPLRLSRFKYAFGYVDGYFARLRARRRLIAGAGLAFWVAAVCVSCAVGSAPLIWSDVAASWMILALIAARVFGRRISRASAGGEAAEGGRRACVETCAEDGVS